MAKTTVKQKPKSTAVTKKDPPKQGALAVPSYMQDQAGKGMGNLDQSDYEMPRVKLIQGISEELQTFDGLKAGDFFHTLAEQSMGQELDVVFLYLSKRYVLWRPRPPIDMGGILARADDAIHWNPPNREFEVKIDKKGTKALWKTKGTVAESGLANWGTYDPSDINSQPAATLCYAMVAAAPDYPDLSPFALLLQRASVKVARKLQGKINISGAPVYGLVYHMTSFVDHGDGGDFNNYRFESNGFVPEADFARYKTMSEGFQRLGVNIKDLEAAQTDTPGGGEETTEAGKRAAKNEKKF